MRLKSMRLGGALMTALLISTSFLQSEELYSVREAVLPIEKTARPGTVVPLGRTTVGTEEGSGAIQVQDEAKNIGFVRWFPGHMLLTGAELADPALRLLVRTRGGDVVPVKAAWRLADDNSTGPVVEGILESKGDEASAALPVPELPEGRSANGLFLFFPQQSEVIVEQAALVVSVPMLLEVTASTDPWKSAPIILSGRGAKAGATVSVNIAPENNPVGTSLTVQATADAKGVFRTEIAAEKLSPGDYVALASEVGSDKKAAAVKFFAFPVLTDAKQPPVLLEKGKLLVDGKPLGFVGVNYSPYHLDLTRQPDYREVVRDLVEIHAWGLKVVRLPVSISIIQPAEGVFPDDPRWAEIMRKHNLDPEIMPLLDYFIKAAGQMGIYSVIDWHGMPTDPYHYHSGGQPSDMGSGKPGEAIAWLAPTPTEAVHFDPSNERHRQAILTTHTWIAKHYKGDPNILGIEIPFNEPHDRFMAVEENWREFTNLAAKAVEQGDPGRLTFTMPSAYGHDNLSPSATWLPPDRASGGAPHFYLANGPVNARADAKDYKQPYLAREIGDSFSYAQASVFMPYSATKYPIYNGEGGEYGNEDFLPHEKFPDRAEWVIEAQIVQAYAAGLEGFLNWTLWNNPNDFEPYKDIYERTFKRFSPVYAAGPLDRTKSEIAIVQSPGAVPPQNGMNHACVPFAKLALDLHIPRVHYYTDEQFLYSFRASIPTGLEQVEEGAALGRYKALIVDRRNLDIRAVKLAEMGGVPVLWTDNAEEITAQQLAEFLEKSGVKVDRRTPAGLQVVEGPEHLLIYARGNETFKTKAYPLLKREGTFRLVDESGKKVFEGDAAALSTQGLDVELPRWTTAIYRIEG